MSFHLPKAQDVVQAAYCHARMDGSITNNDFYVSPSRSRYGDRMFSVAGPRLWNSLPAKMNKTCCLVTFKRLIFTYLLSCMCFTLI